MAVCHAKATGGLGLLGTRPSIATTLVKDRIQQVGS
jgi:hypothetical protein